MNCVQSWDIMMAWCTRCFSFNLWNQLSKRLHCIWNVMSGQLFMCHMRACASHITLPYWTGCYSIYKMENRSVTGRGDEMGDKIEYRGWVSSIATMSPPCTYQTMPCSVIWRKKALNQLPLVSFLIIKMKTRTKYWRSLPFENLFPGNISSAPGLCFFCRSWLQSASCIRTQHHPIILLWTD